MLPLLKRRHVRALQIRVRENYFDVAWPDLFSASLPTMAINADTPIFIPHPARFPRAGRIELGVPWSALHVVIHVPLQSPHRQQRD